MRHAIRRFGLAVAVLMLMAGAAGRAEAGLLLFEANLDGLQEVPPNASPATGFGTVVLDDVLNTITVNLSWQDLVAAPVAMHIHGPAGFGVNAPVLFGLAGNPGTTTGSIPEQSFAITPAQILDLKAELFYFNIHTGTFPGGEIRGQILAVPEPATLASAALAGLVGAGWMRRRSAIA